MYNHRDNRGTGPELSFIGQRFIRLLLIFHTGLPQVPNTSCWVSQQWRTLTLKAVSPAG